MNRVKKSHIFCLFITLNFICINITFAEPNSTVSKGREYYEKRGEIVWEVPSANKQIALTFDDGPDSIKTPKILDLLKQYEAKATFFVVGNRAEKLPDIVKRAQQEGHEIGNHSYSHPAFSRSSIKGMKSELDRTQEIIYKATGHKATLYRPPGGSYNESVVNICKQNELLMILWSWDQDTKDWASPGVGRIVNKVIQNVHDGDIILMHDYVHKSSQTVEALAKILPELKRRGYSFVTVSELLTNKEESDNHIKATK
ncbi:polysaccharide deacetylase family sporulation protein PdaB [Paenibacillus sp. DS2015]|uniref:polysaccharide deacetylase family protein n=1 Tax=Paenibacillus sp. DS2015 TaxID=3373917 RepID=UPI003D24BFA0